MRRVNWVAGMIVLFDQCPALFTSGVSFRPEGPVATPYYVSGVPSNLGLLDPQHKRMMMKRNSI